MAADLRKKQSQQKPVLTKKQFITRILLAFPPLYLLAISVEIIEYETLMALTVSKLLSLTTSSQSSLNTVDAYGIGVAIIPSCTGAVSLAILAAMIISIGKVDEKTQIRVFLKGSAILLAWNILRVYLSILFSKGNLQTLENLHLGLWMFSGAIIAAIWYHWVVKKLGVVLQ